MKNDDISKEKLAAFFPDTTVSDTSQAYLRLRLLH